MVEQVGRLADANGLSSATPIEPVSVSPVPASIPSAEELAELARCSMLFKATRNDARGVGIDFAMKETPEFSDLGRAQQICGALCDEIAFDDIDTFKDWLGSPFAAAARHASFERGDPFWTNAPFTTWQWLVAGCPGVFSAQAIEARRAETLQAAQGQGPASAVGKADASPTPAPHPKGTHSAE